MAEKREATRLARIVGYVEELHRKAAAEKPFDPVFTADYRYEHTLRVARYGARPRRKASIESSPWRRASSTTSRTSSPASTRTGGTTTAGSARRS
ncbi:MAG: hypothetical protein PHX77_05095, partial [Candidatus Bipolaricaulis sp.]|nr:hypothetical protein [Candidatus Bipolaricaulis sp.]